MSSVGIRGEPCVVTVQTPAEREIEKKAKDILLDRRIVTVLVGSGQMTLILDDGGQFSCSAGNGVLQETS